MVFLYETKKAGFISVEASVDEDGEIAVRVNVELGKRETKDVQRVARVALAYELASNNDSL